MHSLAELSRGLLFRSTLFACGAVWWALALHAPALHAQEDVLRQIRMTDVNGRERTGYLVSLTEDALELGGPNAVRIPTRDLYRIDWDKHPIDWQLSDPLLVLASGDHLVLRPESMTDEALMARWARFPLWSPVTLPLEGIRGALLQGPLDRSSRVRLVNRLIDHKTPHDVLVLNNADTVSGQLEALDETGFKLKTSIGDTVVNLSRVAGVGFNPELTLAPRPLRSGAVVSMTDGTIVAGTAFRLVGADKLAFQTTFGAALEIPLQTLAGLQFFGERLAYLSDLEPAAYQFQPYLGLVWPLRRDRSLLGDTLRLRGVPSAKGLGVHSQSDVNYTLNGEWRRFQATVGIDDETSGQGSVVFRVLLDGRQVYESPVLTGTSRPLDLPPIELGQARTLTLRVDYATRGDIQDHADWCAARLVK